MNFIYGLIVGGVIVWLVYKFDLQPKLRSSRDAAWAKLHDFFNGKGKQP